MEKTMNTGHVSEVTRVLQALLDAAQMPEGEGSPITLCSESVDASKIAETCVVMSDHKYKRQPTDGDHANVTSDEYIKYQLGNGFQIIHMAIVRAFNFGATTRHVVMTVMAKMKTN